MGKNIFANVPILNCLVSRNRGDDIEGVNQILKDTDIYGGNTTGVPCYICSRDAYAQIIPKPGVPSTAFIQDKGYICISTAYIARHSSSISTIYVGIF